MNTVISRPNHNKLYSVIEFASAVRLCKYIGIDIYIDIYAYIYMYICIYIYITNIKVSTTSRQRFKKLLCLKL